MSIKNGSSSNSNTRNGGTGNTQKLTKIKVGQNTCLGAADSIVLAASLEEVRHLKLDAPNFPRVFSLTESVVFDKESKSVAPLQEGSKYIQNKAAHGKKFPMAMSVTKLRDETDEKTGRIVKTTFAIATKFWGCTSTSTSILEAGGDDACHLSMSYALVPNNWYGRLIIRLRANLYYKVCLYSLECDFRDLKAALMDARRDKS